VRVPNETLDRFLSSVGEMMLTTSRLRTTAEETGLAAHSTPVTRGFDQMDRAVGELKRRAMELRTTPLLRVFENLPRIARDVAEARGKRVELDYSGSELALDRSILDRLYDPLVHLVRNAADHGIEHPEDRAAANKEIKGRILVGAAREGDSIRIEIRDDGKGIDLEAVRRSAVEAGLIHPDLAEDLPADEIADFIFRPGLSTASQVSEISGRGVGMDAVRTTIESLGGSVTVHTEPGAGTCTTILVPIAAAVQRLLLTRVGAGVIAFPIGKVERILEVEFDDIERSAGEAFISIDGAPTPVFDVASAVGWTPNEAKGEGPVTLLLSDIRGDHVAFQVDGLDGQQELYVKPLPKMLARLPILAGLTVLGNGEPIFLIDSNQLR
jgi:two-component system chemotaxis sensor kinase CheA